MKLLFINLYPPNTLAKYLLSSYVLKGYLEKYYIGEKKLEIQIVNFKATKQIDKILKKVTELNPDVICYSCYIWNIEKINLLIGNLKKQNDFVQILGGPEITINRIKNLDKNILPDYFIIGEGEKTLLELVNYLTETNRISLPEGVAVKKEDSIEYKVNPNRITNLDEIPSIYLNGVIEDELYERQQAYLETQRGCKFKCKYCVYHKSLPSINTYSLNRIKKELEHLIINRQILALRIFDSVFTHDLERAKQIVKYILKLKKRKNVRIPWIYWEYTHDMVDEEFIKLVSELKYRKKILNINDIMPKNRPQHYGEIPKDYTAINCMGIQSFNEQALKAVGRKPVKLEELKKFFNIVNKYNIILKIDLIFGLPFETFDSYLNGLNFFIPFLKNKDHILNITGFRFYQAPS